MALMQRTLLPMKASFVLTPPWAFRRSQPYNTRSSAQSRGQGRPAAPVPEVYTETTDPEITAFQQHQSTAARPTAAEAARTLVQQAKFGLLSTVSVSAESKDLPLGSVVEFALDPAGSPVFAVSSLSAHCSDLSQDKRASLTVMAAGFKGLSDARFSLQGKVRDLSDEEKAPLRELFLAKYPDAFWVDFGDFRWFIMDDITIGRFNGGFASAKKMGGEEYRAAQPDPIAAFSTPVCSHMNGDHVDDMKAMIRHYVGMQVEDARMLDLDRLGMNFEVKHKGQSFKLRLPFTKPAENRKAIKEAIVEMTRAGAA